MATGTAYFLAYKDGRGWEKYLPDIGIYGGFAGIIGARLWDVFFLTGPITATTCQRFSLSGRAAWPSKAASLAGFLPAPSTAGPIRSIGLICWT
ncbi:hypothetical protein M5E89_03700 [Acidaminococcus intestini]|nr:hypothetical protein M5E89_03700 [Acidaminococcus intestini]